MTDPFHALREPVVPAEPDPAFTEQLRTRLRRALLTGEGATVTSTREQAVSRVPAEDVDLHTMTPYLSLEDTRRAIDWYERVFGARRRGEPYVMDDGRVGHAEIVIGDSVLMMADEFPEIGMRSPLGRGGSSTAVNVQVPDVDTVVERAERLGAVAVGEVRDNPYGRTGRFDDPFGHRWLVLTPPPERPLPGAGPAGPGHGEIAYVTMATPDDERAKAFYGGVLGWTFSQGGVESGWQVDGAMIGVKGREDNDAWPCFRVDDLAAALRRVREHGGRAEQPSSRSYGELADCVDDQGHRFHLVGPPRG